MIYLTSIILGWWAVCSALIVNANTLKNPLKLWFYGHAVNPKIKNEAMRQEIQSQKQSVTDIFDTVAPGYDNSALRSGG
jgi:hypothetical protein